MSIFDTLLTRDGKVYFALTKIIKLQDYSNQSFMLEKFKIYLPYICAI